MKEYVILQQINNGCPWHTVTYKTFEEAHKILLFLTEELEYKRKPFYVDNEFYENKYMLGLPNQRYFQIQFRDVSDWVSVDQENNFVKNNVRKKNNQNNILYFKRHIN